MPAFELVLAQAEVAGLTRLPGVVQAGRATGITIEWHDTADRQLAAAGLVLARMGGRWRLERLRAETPGAAPAILAEARSLPQLAHPLPEGLAEIARVQGRRRSVRFGGDAVVHTLEAGGRARLRIDGPAGEVAEIAARLAAAFPVAVPQASFGASVVAAAEPLDVAAADAPPALPRAAAGQSVGDAVAGIVGGLVGAVLFWADRVDGAAPEPVHQLRVATRRLRSALWMVRDLAGWAEIGALRTGLRDCAACAGAARDWDVFLAGTGSRLAEGFSGDRSCTALLRAGGRRRVAAYAALRAYLGGAEFRALTVALAAAAALRPWVEPETTLEDFAAGALARAHRRVRKAGKGIEGLDTPALHGLRKDCKKLRYVAEFLASLYEGRASRRYVKRLAALQEELGRLNDGAAIAGLLGQLGRAERGFAAGLVEGWSAARARPARARIERAWERFRQAAPFWGG